jgi:hypothetical protein
MTQPIIHQPNGYEKAVAELRRIADLLETLPPGFEPEHVGIDIMAGPKDDSNAVAAIDAVAVALLGKPGATKKMSDGRFHHSAAGEWTDPVRIAVFQAVPEPEPTPVACSPECQAQPEERPCLDDCPAQVAARNS